MPRFSIIIPVYNVEPYLRECLDSVLKQTFSDWEAICVDDGSTDSCAAILNDYTKRDMRFRVITQPNGGLSAARNTGLAAATGEYMIFLDSDDWVEPNTLETLHSEIGHEASDTTPIDLLCFGGWHGDKVERPTPTTYPTGWNYYNHCALTHHEFPFVCVVLRCYRRQFLAENRLHFREGILHEDNEFTPRACLAAQTVKVIPDVLYHYRVRPGSIMTTRGLRSKESLLLIASDLAALFARTEGIDRTTVYRHLTQCYQMAFIDNTRDEDRHLLPLVDWQAYRTVSRTRPRHRLNYLLLRLSPSLYRRFNH